MTKQNNKAFLKSISGFCLAIFIGLSHSFAQDKPVNIDKIVAKVDDYIVLKSDVEKYYLEFLSRGRFQNISKCTVLQQLVQNKMFLAQAVIDSVIVEDAIVESEVDQRVESMASQFGSITEMEQQYGKSSEEIKAELFDDIKSQKIIAKMQAELTQNLKVTPSEVKRFFNTIPKDSLPYFSTEVIAAQIVVEPKAGYDQKEKVRRLLLEIKKRIQNGESFESLARQYSEDPGSAAQGGQLPFYSRGQLAPEFEATAMTLNPGEISDPVETQFGYHLIQLQERRGNTFRSRHILVSPHPNNEDILNAQSFIDSLRTVIITDSITFQQAAKDHSDDQMTSSNGGFFQDGQGSNRVSVEQLDPTIFFTLDTMSVGSISKPELFQQQDGSSAYRILYFVKKIPPHQASLKDDYQKIATAALNKKRNEIINEYFQGARDNVYIEIDPEFEHCQLVE